MIRMRFKKSLKWQANNIKGRLSARLLVICKASMDRMLHLLKTGLSCPEMSLQRESSFDGFSQKEQDICNSYIVAEKKKVKQASEMNFRRIASSVFQATFSFHNKKVINTIQGKGTKQLRK